MQYCPNCNAQLDDEVQTCHNCGAQVQGGVATDQGQYQQEDQYGQQPQEEYQQQPPGGSQQRPPRGPGQPPRESEKIGPLTRRQALYGAGGVVAVGAAWLLFGDDSNASGPEGTVRSYLDAVEAGDRDAAASYVHQDAPARQQFIDSAANPAGSFAGENVEVSITLEEAEVVSRESEPGPSNVEEFAIVETTITTYIESGGRSESDTSTSQVRLAKNSAGNWKLWGQAPSTTGQQTPAASLAFVFEPGSDGPGDGRLRITHEGGESLLASALRVSGDGINTVDSRPTNGFERRFSRLSSSLSASSMVSAGDEVQLEADTTYDVRVVWEDPGSENAATLASDEGPDA